MRRYSCFKAYDVRGRLGAELNAEIAERIGRAFGEVMGHGRIVLGRDCRLSSDELAGATRDGLIAAGCEVLDLGLCGTEEVYFATDHTDANGGIMVTASHNPMDYNGMKLVQRGAAPLAGEQSLAVIKAMAETGDFSASRLGGRWIERRDLRAAYVERVIGFVDVSSVRPLKIVVDAGNGAAGPTFDALAKVLNAKGAPLEFVRLNHQPDGSFPNGIPNPLLPENRAATVAAVRDAGADMGVAWDGDFDRCFLFDHLGNFVAGEYVVGLLAEVFLAKEPGATIIHDPRVVMNTLDVVRSAGGQAVAAPTGHAFLKQAMRMTGAVYGGEMSAHHYFRDFMSCDSGMIPWLLIVELMGRQGQSLASLLAKRRAAFPSSGEINFRVADVRQSMAAVEAVYAPIAVGRDDLDGLSLCFEGWRFNLRASNTEPLLRLNVEAEGDAALVADQVRAISAIITGGHDAEGN